MTTHETSRETPPDRRSAAASERSAPAGGTTTSAPAPAVKPRRRRRWKRWVLLFLAGFAVAGVVAFNRMTSPERVRALLEAKLGEVCRGAYEVKSATLHFFSGRLELEGVEIRATEAGFADPPAIRIEKIRAGLDVWALIFGGGELREAEASGVQINLIESADGSRSNFSGLFGPSPKPSEAGGVRPTLRVRDAKARLWRAAASGGPAALEAETPKIELDLSPDVRRSDFFSFRVATGTTPAAPIFGSVRLGGPLRVEVTAAEIPLSAEIAGALPPKLRRIWSAFAPAGRSGPEGRLTDVSAVADAQRNLLTFQASFDKVAAVVPTYRLKELARDAAPPPQTPAAPTSDYAYVTEAAGLLEFSGHGLSVSGRALINGRLAEFHAAMEELDAPVVGLRVRLKVPQVEARESLWVYRDLSPAVRNVVAFLEPQARAALEIAFDRPAGKRIDPRRSAADLIAAAGVLPVGLPLLPSRELSPQPEIAGRIDVTDCSVRAKPFPYFVEKVRGRIEFAGRRAVMEFVGAHGPASVQISGQVTFGTGPLVGSDLYITGQNVPLDAELENALAAPTADAGGTTADLRPNERRLYQGLAPAGRCDIALHYHSPSEFTSDFRVEIGLILTGAADFNLPDPPLRVHDASGLIELVASRWAPPHTRVYGVVGRTVDGTLTMSGEFGTDRSGKQKFWVDFGAADLALSERLAPAIPPEFRVQYRDMKLDGRIDLTGRVSRVGGDPVEYDISARIRDVVAAPAKLPRRIEKASGNVRIRPDLMELSGFTGRAGTATFSAAGEIRPIKGDFGVTVSAQGLELDRTLYDALEPDDRRQWDALRPAGKVDVNARLSGEFKEGGKRRAEMDVTAVGASINPVEFPYPLTDVRGVVRVRPGEVRFDNVKAKHGVAEWTVGGTVRHGPAATQAELSLSGRKVPLDDRLRAALPADVRETLRAADPRGAFDLDVDLAAVTEQGRITGWQFDAKADIRDGAVNIARRLENIRGTVRGRGEFFTADGRWLVAGDFALDRAKFIELEFAEVAGRFDKRADSNRLTIGRLSGKTCGGMFNGGASLELRKDGKYEAKLTADNIDLFEFWRGYTGKAASMSGRFRAVLAARGSQQGTGDLEMAGDLVCRNGRLGETLPDEVAGRPGAAKAQPKALTAANSFSFDGMSLRYRRRGDTWTFEDIIVEGSGVRLAGRGGISPKDEVDMIFVVVPPADGAKVPLISELIRGFTNELVQLRVSGSTAHPQITQRNLDQLGAPLRDLLRTVRPVFVDEKKDKP